MIRSEIQYNWNYTPRFLYSLFVLRPKLLYKLIFHPSQLLLQSSYPEMKRKGKVRICIEKLWNIIRYADDDNYYFMYGLDVKRPVRNSEYLVYREFELKRNRLNLSNVHNDSAILRNKFFFEAVAKLLGITTPRNFAYSDYGDLIWSAENQSEQISWEQFPDRLPDCTIFAKPIDGECGSGIIKLTVKDGEILQNSKTLQPTRLKELFCKGRYIFQEGMTQHSEMSRLYPLSVNTVRLVTIRNPETKEIEILMPTLRVGARGNFVDNYAMGGIIVNMDKDTGNLLKWGFSKPQYGSIKCTEHPDTKVVFSSFKVPYFQEAVKMAQKFHSFLNLHSIGWDIAISDKGPVFIEGNDNWEVTLHQSYDQPLKKEFNRLFGIC